MTITHGKIHSYNHLGCRCDACRAAKAEYRRALKHRQADKQKAEVVAEMIHRSDSTSTPPITTTSTATQPIILNATIKPSDPFAELVAAYKATEAALDALYAAYPEAAA
jgi:hypothetical protein